MESSDAIYLWPENLRNFRRFHENDKKKLINAPYCHIVSSLCNSMDKNLTVDSDVKEHVYTFFTSLVTIIL